METGIVKFSKKHKIRWKQSIWIKQLTIFAVVLTINLIFSGILYYNATAYVRKSVYDKMNAQAGFYLETLDNQMANTQNILLNLFSDRKLAFLVHPVTLLDDYELRDAYLSEQERILMLKNSNSLIETGIIYLPKTEWYISDITIGELKEEELEKVRALSLLNNKGISLFDGGLYMVSTGVPYNQEQELPNAMFVVKFDKEKVRKSLQTFNTIEGSGSFLYDGEEDIFIHSNGEDDNGKEILEIVKEKLAHGSGLSDAIILHDERYQIFVAQSEFFGYFVQYVPEKEILKDISFYKWVMFIYMIAVCGISVYFSRRTQILIHKPLSKLVDAFAQAEKEGLNYEGTQNYGENEFSYLFERFNKMQDHQKMLMEEVVEQKDLAQKAELKQLQAQINPHFLYNSFMSLRNKIRREDLEGAEQLAGHLSSYFQFITRNDESNVLLKDEVAHARSYTSIQQIRFYDRIKVEFEDLPEEYGRIEVPRLILQPVIENALKYGLEDKEKDGLLNVVFVKKTHILEIQVHDNGDHITGETIEEMRRKIEQKESITGIVNIHHRLKLYFGEKAGLRIEQSSLGGVEVIICIPV
ncbi:MAG: sensor histidine kinase [Oliverpabstia sp.]